MAERSDGSSSQTAFSSDVSATSAVGSGVRAAAGWGDRCEEPPQAADQRHSAQVKMASTAADFMGTLTVTRHGGHGRSRMRLATLLISSTLLLSFAFAADAQARVPDRPALKVARMAADSLLARHREMPQGGWAGRALVQAPPLYTQLRRGG